MKIRGRFWGLVVVSVFLGAGISQAQSTATILGTVHDSTGAVIPGAAVTIRNADTGISRTVTTDASGRYRAPQLGLGNYEITAESTGFQSIVRSGVTLTVGREATVDFTLQVGAVAERITVTGEAPLVETTKSSVGYLTAQSVIQDLPLAGRDLSQLMTLSPGVAVPVNASQDIDYRGYGKKISISGMRAMYNSFLLDNSYILDKSHIIPAGPRGALLGADTVREFEVITNPYDAKYGRALGGVINAVSRSGTNEWHGSAYEYLRNDDLDAARWEDNALGKEKPAFVRNQFGATFGGPIVRDKAFFFLAYEAVRERLNSTRTANVPDEKARLGILPGSTKPITVHPFVARYLKDYWPLPSPGGRNFGDGRAEFIWNYDENSTDDFGQARVDYQLSPNDTVFFRFTGSRANRTSPMNYPVHRQVMDQSTRFATLEYTRILSPTLLNTLHFAFNRVAPVSYGTFPDVPPELRSMGPYSKAGPQLSIGSGVTAFSGWNWFDDWWIVNRFEFRDDVNLSRRSHSLRFGYNMERTQLNAHDPNRPMGDWTFRSLADFLKGVPRGFRGSVTGIHGNGDRGTRQWLFGFHFQDNWQVKPGLMLNMGIRWDPFTVPVEVDGIQGNLRSLQDPYTTVGEMWVGRSKTNFSPRIGIAWSPFPSGRTSIRAGFGVFYMPNDTASYEWNLARLTPDPRRPDVPLYMVNRFTTIDPQWFPDGIKTAATGSLVGFGTTQVFDHYSFQSQHALQYNFTIQQQLGEDTMVNVGYTGTRGINLLWYPNINAPEPKWSDALQSLYYPAGTKPINPNFASIDQIAPATDSWYNGFTVSLARRLAAGLEGQVGYTFSKALSTADHNISGDWSGGGGAHKSAYISQASKSLSAYDLTHVLQVRYSYELPLGSDLSGVANALLAGWQLQGIITAQSGQPIAITSGTSTFLNNITATGISPNLKPGFSQDEFTWGAPNISKDPTGKGRYFNPNAFYYPGANALGNLARYPARAPGLATWDFTLSKNFQLREGKRLQFRTEVYNFLNRPNFGLPVQSAYDATGAAQGNFGIITRTNTSARQIQFGLKLTF